MKRIEKDGEILFVGRALRCPACGKALVKAPGLFCWIAIRGAEGTCPDCGCEFRFGLLGEDRNG